MNESISKIVEANKVNMDVLSKLDNYTLEHSKNVLTYSHELGKLIGLTKQSMNNLLLGAALHDVGKQFVPEEILNKSAKLTEEEFEVVKAHPKMGYEHIKSNSNVPDEVLSVILDHHERPDGLGYPGNKVNDEISTLAKIVAVCDVYDALTSNRVYRCAMGTQKAVGILESAKGTQLDKILVEMFVNEVIPNL